MCKSHESEINILREKSNTRSSTVAIGTHSGMIAVPFGGEGLCDDFVNLIRTKLVQLNTSFSKQPLHLITRVHLVLSVARISLSPIASELKGH